MKKFLSALFALSALTLVTTTTLAQSTSPKLTIITPSESQTIYGNKMPVLFSVENFKIVDYQTNPTPVPSEGHIHLWLDDQNPTAQSAVKITQDNYTFPDVAYGDHILRAELVASDHKSLVPPQVVVISFKNDPIATPSPTATSGFDKNTALVILVVVALVIIAAWWYTKEEDEEERPKPASTRKTANRRSTRKRRK